MLCVTRVYKITTIASLLDCMCILVFVVVFFFILEMFNQMFNRRDNAIEYPEKTAELVEQVLEETVENVQALPGRVADSVEGAIKDASRT